MPLGTVARLGLVALALSGLASCRSLTTNETAFISEQFRLDTARRRVDLSVVRIGCLDLSRGEALASARNEILADLGTQTVTTRNGVVAASTIDTQVAGTLLNGRALTIGNRIFFKSPLCQSDMAAGWPGAPINPVNDMALFGHEILHVWQWQNRRVTGYSLLKVLIEHIEHGNDVYKYDIVPGQRFLTYRFEQQGQMMEDYIVSRFLSPPNGNPVLRRLIMEALDVDQMTAAASQALGRPRP